MGLMKAMHNFPFVRGKFYESTLSVRTRIVGDELLRKRWARYVLVRQ
jgi:hypothetical protein